MPRASLLTVIVFSLVLAVPTCAQDSATGAIHGIVLDPAGSRIAQASIVVVNSATGTRYSTSSDTEGRFALDLLPPGDYSARAVAEKMSPQVTPQLHVEVGAVVELQFHLTIASAQEKVTSPALPRWSIPNPAVSTLFSTSAPSPISRSTAAASPISCCF
ncbi:MAG: carboxypeptidase-like regulatory domain-containing protein, partial [Candidatus Sulfotelmatobacter sp.]